MKAILLIISTVSFLAVSLLTVTSLASQPVDLEKYDHLDPSHIVPEDLLLKAVTAYEQQLSHLDRKEVITVIDFSKRSSKPRFFIVDMKSGRVEALHVAHGKGSDPEYSGFAKKFSNTPDSLMSSLGVYVTAETYYGQHGQSLRLDGLSATNSNARERAIVIHGAKYVSDENQLQGRSFGCPAVSNKNISKVIQKIGGGSLIYAGISREDMKVSGAP